MAYSAGRKSGGRLPTFAQGLRCAVVLGILDVVDLPGFPVETLLLGRGMRRYSFLRAARGSTRAARRAGIQQAAAAMAVRPKAVMA